MVQKRNKKSNCRKNAAQSAMCRVCGHELFPEPLLRYRNMPKAAQFLPGVKTLKGDRGVSLDVFQCSGCGLVQLRNKPVSYYREVIRAVAFSDEMRNYRIKQFGDFIKKYSLITKKIIEIGCGRGEYLSLIVQFGVNAYGLEYAEDSVKHCKAKGLKVSKGFIQSNNILLSDAPFDSFFMLNFLEHLPDPNSTLSGIYRNLTEGAIGLVEVPNFDMILRKRLFSEFINDHLFYFTKDTFSTTLRINGFDIIECNEEWHEYIISAIVKKRERQDLSLFLNFQEKIKKEIKEYIDRFRPEKIAIWGAGHQALSVISLLELSHKIKYVVDSATFKQGKYTPVTHLPIVSPEKIISDPVDAIIIMAASYSDEVASVIRKNYGRDISISILRDFGLEEV